MVRPCSISFQCLRVLDLRQSCRSKSLRSINNIKATDLDVDAVLLAESLEIFVIVLEELYEEAKSLGLRFHGPKTKVQSLRGLLDYTAQSVHASGKYTEVTESFTYLVK